MTRHDLYAYGAALAGRPQWQAWLARFLGSFHPGGAREVIDDSLVRKWARGARPVPIWAASAILAEAAIALPPDEWIEQPPYLVRLWWPLVVIEITTSERAMTIAGHAGARIIGLPDGREGLVWRSDEPNSTRLHALITRCCDNGGASDPDHKKGRGR